MEKLAEVLGFIASSTKDGKIDIIEALKIANLVDHLIKKYIKDSRGLGVSLPNYEFFRAAANYIEDCLLLQGRVVTNRAMLHAAEGDELPRWLSKDSAQVLKTTVNYILALTASDAAPILENFGPNRSVSDPSWSPDLGKSMPGSLLISNINQILKKPYEEGVHHMSKNALVKYDGEDTEHASPIMVREYAEPVLTKLATNARAVWQRVMKALFKDKSINPFALEQDIRNEIEVREANYEIEANILIKDIQKCIMRSIRKERIGVSYTVGVAKEKNKRLAVTAAQHFDNIDGLTAQATFGYDRGIFLSGLYRTTIVEIRFKK